MKCPKCKINIGERLEITSANNGTCFTGVVVGHSSFIKKPVVTIKVEKVLRDNDMWEVSQGNREEVFCMCHTSIEIKRLPRQMELFEVSP